MEEQDKVSVDRIAKMHPKLRGELLSLFIICNHELSGRAQVRITQTLRTIAEQNALYAQGRTTKGKIVTNAQGGSSFHNYGLAFDFVLILDGKEVSWDTNKDFDGDKKADWMEVVALFKSKGWTWGGDFKSIKDMPHFEKTFGKTLAQVRNLPLDKDGYVKI